MESGDEPTLLLLGPCDKHGMLRSSAHDACDSADLPRPVTTEPEWSHLAGGCTGHRAQWGSRDQEGITMFGAGGWGGGVLQGTLL